MSSDASALAHPAKRRRLNTGNVNKPFRSPLRVVRDENAKTGAKGGSLLKKSDTTVGVVDATGHSEERPAAIDSAKTTSNSIATRTAAVSAARDRVTGPRIPPSKVTSTATTQTSSEIIHLRLDIATLSQALRLIQPNSPITKATDLSALENKWRLAAQQAAEEVFCSAKEKIQRMGGVEGLKDWEREREKREVERRREEFEDMRRERERQMEDAAEEEEEAEDGNEEGRRDESNRREKWEYDFREDGEGDHERIDRDEQMQDQKGLFQGYEDDDSFTIGMMLKTLGIDPSIIGYDEERQTWAT